MEKILLSFADDNVAVAWCEVLWKSVVVHGTVFNSTSTAFSVNFLQTWLMNNNCEDEGLQIVLEIAKGLNQPAIAQCILLVCLSTFSRESAAAR